ncbi:hypothetical protein SELMODRAFT_404541 [Selaginella moellendorffii]|uniref:Uncharacterized protein n=1 Tax=Selaginella moellendorffii TaxID=88036 RepID=D8QVN5_SELML|nr:hypothetical protein SELMODRAFT_404539 [Selaginella moellendorffii]EFJ36488.1 hypothetical protein SELMODRAFT_404541 [Selaginella moellendorffii]
MGYIECLHSKRLLAAFQDLSQMSTLNPKGIDSLIRILRFWRYNGVFTYGPAPGAPYYGKLDGMKVECDSERRKRAATSYSGPVSSSLRSDWRVMEGAFVMFKVPWASEGFSESKDCKLIALLTSIQQGKYLTYVKASLYKIQPENAVVGIHTISVQLSSSSIPSEDPLKLHEYRLLGKPLMELMSTKESLQNAMVLVMRIDKDIAISRSLRFIADLLSEAFIVCPSEQTTEGVLWRQSAQEDCEMPIIWSSGSHCSLGLKFIGLLTSIQWWNASASVPSGRVFQAGYIDVDGDVIDHGGTVNLQMLQQPGIFLVLFSFENLLFNVLLTSSD